MKRFYGCHVSAAGGFQNSVLAAKELNVNAIQIHPSPPQRWLYQPFPEGVENNYLEMLPDSPLEKVFLHNIYLINLANIDEGKWELSKKALVHALDLAKRMKAEGVIFHVGSNTSGLEEEEALERCARGITGALAQADSDCPPLLLEVSAGSGNIIGDEMEELRAIADMVNQPTRVAFALDTQHMWASGYDLRTKLEEVILDIDKQFGLKNVKCIHLNDSKTACGSRKDRHENLGDGLIGKEAISRIVSDSRLLHIPLVMETPDLDTPEGAKKEVAALAGLIG